MTEAMDGNSKQGSSLDGNSKQGSSLDRTLVDAVNKLRGFVPPAEFRQVVLNLVFLKVASVTFMECWRELSNYSSEDSIGLEEYCAAKHVVYLPVGSRWGLIQGHRNPDDLAVVIDVALQLVQKANKSLRGMFPDNYVSRLHLDAIKLRYLVDAVDNIFTEGAGTDDVVGRMYEYFLGNGSSTVGKGGQFYTPRCVVDLITAMLEPFRGIVYDPCCGTGGMFVQSPELVRASTGGDVTFYSQEAVGTAHTLARMNLAMRGIAGNLGRIPADTLLNDQHPGLAVDFIMANPPFNQKAWRAADELIEDTRWSGYDVPPTGNANYGWILHIISKLSENGVAGIVLANGTLTTTVAGEASIRRRIIENDLLDCMIALPRRLFYNTQLSVCLWILSKSKNADTNRGYRARQGETLFIDVYSRGSITDRSRKELSVDEIADIARTYHAWRGEDTAGVYEDKVGYCKSASLEEIKKHDYVLTPGLYVGVEEIDAAIPFVERFTALQETLYAQFAEGARLEKVLRELLGRLENAS